MILYAIYKNGLLKGNQRGSNELDAIKKYIIEFQLVEFFNDERLLKIYNATIAIKGLHYEESVALID